MKKIERLRDKMKQDGVEGVVVYSDHHRFYFSGFTGSTGCAVVTKNKAYFLTDFRYTLQAKEQCRGFEVIEVAKKYEDYFNQIFKEEEITTVGFEADFLTHQKWMDLEAKLACTMKHIDLAPLRMVKTADEIEVLKHAAKIADEAYEYILGYVKAGMSEREVETELVRYMKSLGASDASFETIVASGERGSMPHGVASDKIIDDGDFVTLDFGAKYHGYISDITRTFVVGKQGKEELHKIYDIVLQAQMAALEACKPGMTGAQLDKIARDIIAQAGYGDCFGHSLGHGIGVLVHEGPSVGATSTIPFEPGMVITIEPGIYVPNLGGVRIEDDVVITTDGCERLTKSSKQLKYVG